MVMMLRVPLQFPAFLLVATRSLALRGAWFSGSACVGQSSPNGLASPRAGRARLHGLHGHWVGGGLEQEKIIRNCRNCRINRTQQNKRDSAIEGDCSYQREDRGQELHCGVARHPLNCTSCLQPRNCRINTTQQNKRESAIKSVCSDALWSSKASIEFYLMPPAPELPHQWNTAEQARLCDKKWLL